MLKKHIMPVLLMSSVVSGCSTLTSDGTSQNLSVFTYGTDNEMLSGANCELSVSGRVKPHINGEGYRPPLAPRGDMRDLPRP
ncbi:MAG: hypothetical protein AB2812_12990, partial [Candidatus Sedimenticola endophacoides]